MWLAVILTWWIAAPASADVRIVELLPDPPNDIAGDANHDGNRSAIEDEFVELLNTGNAPMDLSNWTLSDAAKVRHTFPAGTTLAPRETLVVFGGGQPQGIKGHVFTAVAGTLSLNNNGDVVTLRDSAMEIMDSISYDSAGQRDQSLVRNGDGELVLHTSLEGAQDALYSPGVVITQ